jgi:pyrrolysine biosynthesis protein PylC
MRVGVIGGKLQGVEAAYLARKAGWQVIVVDRRANVPAAGLCDRFVQLDVSAASNLGHALDGVDLVIPALENDAALACLDRWTRANKIPFAFDPAAYGISSSKVKSNRLFARAGVATPLAWPGCGFPVVAKPSAGSGSDGVNVFHDPQSLPVHIKQFAEQWVVQEFVPGPSYSLEVIGRPGQYVPLQVTDLSMDPGYDCKRVMAPTDLTPTLVRDFEQIAVTLAEKLGLKGLMDVEVVLHRDTLKVLEIDARLPSQTPTAVYWSRNINMVELLGELFIKRTLSDQPVDHPCRGVVYEHINVSPGLLETAGEHIMSDTDALRIQKDFFGADEAITNYTPGRQAWVATLILCGKNRKAAWEKRNRAVLKIRERFELEMYRDATAPEQPRGDLV